MAGQPHSPQQLLGATGHLKQEASRRAPGQLSQARPTMDSAYEMSLVRKLQAQHTQMQEKTFTNWINNIFWHGQVSVPAAPHSPPLLSPSLPGQQTQGQL